jgi:DNA-binding helix-hairpin-helix protein with protein kinase domain
MTKINKKKILGRGATATIYLAEDSGQAYAAKIFHDKKKMNLEKVQAMIDNPPKNSVSRIDGIPYLNYAWPKKIVWSSSNEPIGFLMPLIDLKNSFSLDYFYDKILFSKLQTSNEVALTFKLAIARNLCKVVSKLHKNEHFFIDLKPQNIRVYKGTHAITLLDCDGFAIKSKSGKKYSAELMSTDYIAPEATLNNSSPKQLGLNQDLYALAVILFQLLNNGTHPFQGILKGNFVANTNDEKAARGFYPHGLVKNNAIEPRPQSIHLTWLNSTRILFDNAFAGLATKRPNPETWSKHFDELLKKKNVVRCLNFTNDLNHLRFKDMDCPTCYLTKINQSKSQKKTSNVPPNFANTGSISPSKSGSGGSSFWGIFILIILVLIILFNLFPKSTNEKNDTNYYRSSNAEQNAKAAADEANLAEERMAQERMAQERMEQERMAQERMEQERMEQERMEQERMEQSEYEYAQEEMKREHQELQEKNKSSLSCLSTSGYCKGKATYTSIRGDRVTYDGEWLNGKLNGYGSIVHISGDFKGDIFEGQFLNNNFIEGTYYYKSRGFEGDIFEGQLLNDNYSEGTYYYNASKHGKNRGDVYRGQFNKEKRHGYGVYTFKNGETLSGQFKNDEFIGGQGSEGDNNSLDWLQKKPDVVPSRQNSFGN